jgi:hypothetical protein
MKINGLFFIEPIIIMGSCVLGMPTVFINSLEKEITNYTLAVAVSAKSAVSVEA